MEGATKKITGQEGGFCNFLRPLMTGDLPVMKDVLTPLTKRNLLPLELAAAASVTDAAIKKKILGSQTTLVFSNEEMGGIIKIMKFLEDADLLMKGISETVENEVKEQKGGFLCMLAATSGASLLGNLLRGGDSVIGAGEGTNRAGQDFSCHLIL